MTVPSTDIFGNPYPDSGVPTLNGQAPPMSIFNERGGLRRSENGVNITVNDDWSSWLQGYYLLRVAWMQAIIDPRRDLDKECGYPYVILPKQYYFMWQREGIASRCVNIYPDECWAVDPQIYEGEEPLDTPFEMEWQRLIQSETSDPLHYLHRIDVMSGIGRYGTLLLGVDDGNVDLEMPLEGIDDRGEPTKKTPSYRLLYMRPFDELMSHIIRYERDASNPRFGKPTAYLTQFADIRVGEPGMTAAAVSISTRVVHWSRVIHVADNRESSEVFGVPRQQTVFNRLCDVRKVLGGSAEMFYKGGFPGYAFELNPSLTTAGVTLDDASLKKQFEEYSNGLSRYLAVVGLQTKSLAPQVANPDPTMKVQLEAIAISLGVPLRIFTGSEQAQLASGQDVRTWNRRLKKRQERYLTPKLIRPFVDRLIAFGILPKPNGGTYKVWWPDINLPSDMEQSQIADRQSAAIMKYVTGGGYQLIPPFQFLTLILKLPVDQAKTIAKAINGKLKGNPTWPEITPPAVEAQAVKGEVAASLSKDSGGGSNE